MTEALTVVGTVGVIVAVVFATVWIGSRRNLATKRPPLLIPAQRSPLTQAELLKLNQLYGAGQIGEAEYARRRRELLSRTD